MDDWLFPSDGLPPPIDGDYDDDFDVIMISPWDKKYILRIRNEIRN